MRPPSKQTGTAGTAISLDRILGCGDDFNELWSLFAACLAVFQANCLYIIPDNIDRLLAIPNNKTGAALEEFFTFLSGLANTKRLVCKIMLTSRSNMPFKDRHPKTAEMLQHINSANRSHLKVPPVHQFGSTHISEKEKRRFSVARPKQTVSDDLIDRLVDEQVAQDASASVGTISESDKEIDLILNSPRQNMKPKSPLRPNMLKGVSNNLDDELDDILGDSGSDVSNLLDLDDEREF